MKHIEDLPKDQIMHIVDNIQSMDISEKIDGSNLTFGFDDDGRFFTTRNNKGKKELYYTPDDYPCQPVNNTFIAAHAALSAIVGDKPIPTTQYEVEVLFGRQPNAVVYGENRIVFISDYPFPINNKETTTCTPMLFSDDGTTLYQKQVVATWILSDIPQIKVKHIPLSPSLNREEIKQILAEKILRTIQPAFRTVDVRRHEDFGIEGVVIKDHDTGIITKLIDKHTFTLINQFNFAIRNEIKSVGPRFKPANNRNLYRSFIATVGYQQKSLYDVMLTEFAGFIGIDGLGAYMTITRTLKKYQSVGAFLDDWAILDVDTAKSVFVHIVDTAIGRLAMTREAFLAQWKTYKLVLLTGQTIRYSKEIHNRTLVVFAENLKELTELREKIEKATDWSTLATALYEKQLHLAFPNQ